MRGKTGFAKAVKKVILSTAESKYRSVDLKDASYWNSATVVGSTIDAFSQIACGHNALFQIHIINNHGPDPNKHPIPAQGDGDNLRNGDEIYAKGFRIRMQIENDAGKHNNTWKFWLVEWNTIQGTPCIPSEFFHAVTGNNLLDTVQTDRWKANLLGVFRTKARDVDPTSKTNVFINKWIPFRRKLCFKSDDSLVVAKGMKGALTLVGVCYDSSNTAYNTGAGNLRVNATFYYGDP